MRRSEEVTKVGVRKDEPFKKLGEECPRRKDQQVPRSFDMWSRASGD